MRDLLRLLKVFTVLLIVTFTPFYILAISTKYQELRNRDAFQKVKIKVDSLGYAQHFITNDPSISVNVFYANKNKSFHIEHEKNLINYLLNSYEFQHMLDYMKKNNDSIWIWQHPDLGVRYAKENQLKLNVSNNWLQIITSGILLAISLYAIIWQIISWIKF